MAKLVFSAIESLDGYVADEAGRFDWAQPDESVHMFVNELQRPVCTYLFGRRMYEVMVAWETLDRLGDQPPYIQDFANMWRAASKIVYFSTLDAVRGSVSACAPSWPESVTAPSFGAVVGSLRLL